MPAQHTVFPAQVQVQHCAAAPVHPLARLDYGYGLILPVGQPVAGQRGGVEAAAGGVKPPVFGDAKLGVAAALAVIVVVGGAEGRHFQDEIGQLALAVDAIPPLGADVGRVYVEGDQQVGYRLARLQDIPRQLLLIE